MAKHPNYLIAGGERLVEDIPAPKMKLTKDHPYLFTEAQEFLTGQLRETAAKLDELPQLACPNGRTVACLTLHPAYLAMSYYPKDLFKFFDLEPLGSKQTIIEPRKPKGQRKRDSKVAATTTFFVAGKRETFHDFADVLLDIRADSKEAADIRKIETITPQEDKVRAIKKKEPLLEVVLHAPLDAGYIIQGFKTYLESLDIGVDLKKRLQAGGLCFLPVEAPLERVEEIADYSFLRVVREMPKLRMFRPMIRSGAMSFGFNVKLPTDSSVADPTLRVAVFDGGLPASPDLAKWVNYKEPPGLKNSVPKLEEHGLAVTSALLFSSMTETTPLTVPFSKIDHYRVLDEDALKDKSYEYHDVIRRIRDILQQEKYDFVNLSIGPPHPIANDEDVHAWTSILDDLLADGETLSAVAVGNDGLEDWGSGMARIQPPSDCVNALSIGSADTQSAVWQRAGYSCIGPGRGPGYVKPDALSFGGCDTEPFYVLQPNINPLTQPIGGTSFASPNALRTAIGVRATLGSALTPLAVKALVLHRCEFDKHDPRQVGWGRIPTSVDELITCEDNTAHIIYKGVLSAGTWVKATIPVPVKDLDADIEIAATLCYATEVDPSHTINYTRGGLRVIFRPNVDDLRELSQEDLEAGREAAPKTKTFFRNKLGGIAQTELRDDALVWETTRSDKRLFRKATIKEPTFDIHYKARANGAPTDNRSKIPYALVITVRQKNNANLYNSIVTRNQYRSKLEILRPVLRIPIRN